MNSKKNSKNKSEVYGTSWQGSGSDKHDSLPGDDGYHQKISEAAYYNAQQRAFEPGKELSDWLRAEAQEKNYRFRAN